MKAFYDCGKPWPRGCVPHDPQMIMAPGSNRK